MTVSRIGFTVIWWKALALPALPTTGPAEKGDKSNCLTNENKGTVGTGVDIRFTRPTPNRITSHAQPNLARGRQHWLSGYASWYAKRNDRSGHLFQGRYKSYPVESASYFWTLSRYLHLNPCRGKNVLVERPEDWRHSSYRGYARSSRREDFVADDILFLAWEGECGGKDPAAAYRKFVRQGLDGARIEEVIAVVAEIHEVDPSEYAQFRSRSAGREMAALLCRRFTRASLAELSARFGLGHPSSSANLVTRAKQWEESSAAYSRRIKEVESRLTAKIENEVDPAQPSLRAAAAAGKQSATYKSILGVGRKRPPGCWSLAEKET